MLQSAFYKFFKKRFLKSHFAAFGLTFYGDDGIIGEECEAMPCRREN
jgi:hypothetical protein